MAVDNGNSYKSGGGAALAAPVHSEPVGLAVEEKLTVLLNKDGGMENMEVQGSMSLQARRCVTLPGMQLRRTTSTFAQRVLMFQNDILRCSYLEQHVSRSASTVDCFVL